MVYLPLHTLSPTCDPAHAAKDQREASTHQSKRPAVAAVTKWRLGTKLTTFFQIEAARSDQAGKRTVCGD